MKKVIYPSNKKFKHPTGYIQIGDCKVGNSRRIEILVDNIGRVVFAWPKPDVARKIGRALIKYANRAPKVKW